MPLATASLFQAPAESSADAKDLSDQSWAWRLTAQSIPHEIAPIIPWATANVRLFGEDGTDYNPIKSPWTIYPLELAADPDIFTLTFVKPVQTGGSTVGEIALLYRIMTGYGQILYNWPDNKKAEDRWDKYTEKRIKHCAPVARLMPVGGFGSDRSKIQKGLIVFPHITVCQQGVEAEGNLDSDSVGFIINEEVHAWSPGRIMKARGRQTRVAWPKFITISNAGFEGDQLHEEYQSGTRQHLLVKCPGCREFHTMRTRWEDSRPELGGLRYDTEHCKRDDGTFNYNKLLPTIHYRMPCGFRIENDVKPRRALSSFDNIKWSDPTNDGALLSNRSLTHEAVLCHNINWLDLIQQKHAALRALKNGDSKPWIKYLQERECVFYSTEHIPYQGAVLVTPAAHKTRAGLEGRCCRAAGADKQRGFKHLHEISHYWLVIEDILPNCSSQVIYEGQVGTDAELVATLDEYEVPHSACFVDCSWDTKAVLEFCYRNGINAVMANVSHKGLFLHKDKHRRWYSPSKPIHVELNMPQKYDYSPTKDGWVPNPQEPIILQYNKAGLLANHFFIRDHKKNVIAAVRKEVPARDPDPGEYIERIIPGDVSEDFKLQNESWERVANMVSRTNDEVEGFRRVRKADHLLMCCAYIDLLKEESGLLGDYLATIGMPSAH